MNTRTTPLRGVGGLPPVGEGRKAGAKKQRSATTQLFAAQRSRGKITFFPGRSKRLCSFAQQRLAQRSYKEMADAMKYDNAEAKHE